MTTVSHTLRQTREQKGISLDEVANRTYIKLPYLESLEQGKTDGLPASVYVHGYIRQYAKLLGLDGSELVLRYQQEASTDAPSKLVLKAGRGPHLAEAAKGAKEAPREAAVEVKVVAEQAANLPAVATVGTWKGLPPLIAGGPAVAVAERVVPAAEPAAERTEANQILTRAQREADAVKAAAERYADQVLSQLEAEIHRTLQTIRNGRSYLQDRLREPRIA